MRSGSGHRPPSSERWLLSYADFITLLFVLFAMMYAASSVDAEKLLNVSHGLQVAFDDTSGGRSIAAGAGMMPERGSRLVAGLDGGSDVWALVTRELEADLAAHRLDIVVDHRGLVLSIPEAGLFPIGTDEISPAAQVLIARVAATVAKVPNQVRVEGHTDDLPIHTLRFRSNWDLSTARASRVIEFMVEHGGIDIHRLSAAGYAEFRPRVLNTSPDTRKQNRRVDVVILNDVTARTDEPSSTVLP